MLRIFCASGKILNCCQVDTQRHLATLEAEQTEDTEEQNNKNIWIDKLLDYLDNSIITAMNPIVPPAPIGIASEGRDSNTTVMYLLNTC